MFELILYNLSSSWMLIVTFLITLFLIGCVIYIFTKNFNMKNGKIKTYGMLLGISNINIFILSIIIVRAFLLIYCITYYQENVMMSLAMIGIISIIYIVFNIGNVLFEIINMVALMAVTYFIYTLNTYMIEVNSNDSVKIVKTVLIAFSAMYAIYISLKSFEEIITSNKNINE